MYLAAMRGWNNTHLEPSILLLISKLKLPDEINKIFGKQMFKTPAIKVILL